MLWTVAAGHRGAARSVLDGGEHGGILKELVDNALDKGANARIDHQDGAWVVSDDGPGLDPTEVVRLFAVNRPLLSSKLKRLPLRGMLGNGLRVVAGAVVAFNPNQPPVESYCRFESHE